MGRQKEADERWRKYRRNGESTVGIEGRAEARKIKKKREET